MKIEKIYVYPIKALRAVEVQEAQLTKHGFPHDRRFMLIHLDRDQDGNTIHKNIAVAYYPQSVLFHPTIDPATDTLTITYKPPTSTPPKSLDIPLTPPTSDLDLIDVVMHRSPCKAYQMPRKFSDWFSDCYGIPVILVYLGPRYRPVLMSQFQPPSTTTSSSPKTWLSTLTTTATSLIPSSSSSSLTPSQSTTTSELLTFTDVAPYLICSTASIHDVETRLPRPPPTSSTTTTTTTTSKDDVPPMLKFRPNLTIAAAPRAWDEDFWAELTINGRTRIRCVHNCARCKSINIDYGTGEPAAADRGGALLKALQVDRRVDPGMKWSPVFGRYCFLEDEAEGHVVRVGDEVVVTGRNEERSKFDWEGLHTL